MRAAFAEQISSRSCVGDLRELTCDDLSRVRPRRRRMREVGRPQDVLDADEMTHVQPDLVVHERDRHVAVEVLTRLQAQIREVVRPGDLAVELAEEAGDPVEAGFDEHDLETREPFERSGEDPPRHDLGECQGRQ